MGELHIPRTQPEAARSKCVETPGGAAGMVDSDWCRQAVTSSSCKSQPRTRTPAHSQKRRNVALITGTRQLMAEKGKVHS